MAINLDELRKKAEQFDKPQGSGGNADFLKNFLQTPDGKTPIRILPGKTEEDNFYAETKIHRVDGEDGNNRNIHCLKVKGEKCPLCDAYYKLWQIYNEGGKTDDSIADPRS